VGPATKPKPLWAHGCSPLPWNIPGVLQEEEGEEGTGSDLEEGDGEASRYPVRQRAPAEHYNPAQVELAHRSNQQSRRLKQV